MAFESWSQKNRDTLRLKRLAIGSSIGAVGLVGGMTYIVMTSQAAAEEVEEEAKVVEVQLAKEPDSPPEPEPLPPPPELKPRKPNPGPRLQKIETPTTISDEKLQEKDAKPADGAGDPYEKGGGDGSTGPKTAEVEAPAPPPPPPAPVLPKVKKPVPASEATTQPEPLVKLGRPEYPADAKAAGLEGTVIVRFVIDEKGNVTNVKALKGPPELFAVCVEYVKSLRYKPALDSDGQPMAVTKIIRFPFRLRT